MHELWEQLERIPVNNQTILIGAALAGLVVFLVFFLLRLIWNDWFGETAKPETEDPVGVLAERYRKQNSQGWAERFDLAVENIILNTGLNVSAEQAMAWILFVGVLAAGGFYLARTEWWMALLGFVLGAGSMTGIIAFYHNRYRWKVRSQLPEIFTMLAQSTRAGLSLEKAIATIGQQRSILIAPELRRCTAQVDLGLSVVVALQSVADRLQLLDFNALVSLVALHQKVGGNLPMQLERLASNTREHNQFHGYLRTATTLGRTSAIAIGLATPVILMVYVIFQPEYTTSFFESTQAWTLIGVALGLEAVGLVWLNQILKIEY